MPQTSYATKTKSQPKTHAVKSEAQVDKMCNQATIKMLSGMYDDSKKTARRIDLDAAMKTRIAKDFGATATNVRVFENPGLDKIGERGFAQGDAVHLAKSVVGSSDEEQVLNHEMGHIVRQSHGVASGSGINLSESLEADADSVQSQSIQSAPSLASESSTQIQGKLATSISGKIKSKFKTMFNIGGYADKKSQARASAAAVTDQGTGIFGKEHAQNRVESILSGEDTYVPDGVEDKAHFMEAINASKRQKSGTQDDLYGQLLNTLDGDMTAYEGLQGLQTQDMTDDEKIDTNNQSLRRLNIMRETISAHQPMGQSDTEIDTLKAKIEAQRAQMLGNMKALPGYGSGMGALRGRLSSLASSRTDEGKNAQNLDALKALEMDALAFQNRYEGAADDGDFKALLDGIEQRYEDCYDCIYTNDWAFHRAGKGTSTPKESRDKFGANDVWRAIKSDSGGLTLDSAFKGIASTSGKQTPTDAQFHRKQMGNIGRLLSTDTGLALLTKLSKSTQKDTVIQRTNLRSDGTYAGAGAGVRDMATGKEVAASQASPGNFVSPGNGSTSSSSGDYGAGTKAYARISPEDRDSSVESYDTSGRHVINPQYLMLGHELTHALHNTLGFNSRYRKMSDHTLADGEKEGVTKADGRWSNLEEFATMFGTDLDFKGSSDSAVKAKGYQQSEDLLRRHPEMAESFRTINEQKLRDEFGMIGRDFHKAISAFPLKKR